MNNSSSSSNNDNLIGASEARNNFSDLLSKVEYGGQEILIERYGEVVAKLVPVEKKVKQIQAKKVEPEKQTEPEKQAEPEKPPIRQHPSSQHPSRQYPRRIQTKPTEAGLSGHYQAIAKQLEELNQLRLKRAEKAEKKSVPKSEPRPERELGSRPSQESQSEIDKRAEVIRKKIKLVLE